MITRVLATASLAALVFVAACSSDDTSSSSTSSGGSSSTSSGSSGTSSTSSTSSTTSSSGGSECTSIDQCPKLTCVCGSLSGAQVQNCTNGVCAKTCAEAGCK